jgi:formylglycine-generating enzyme required for sulfatase activity
MRAAMRWTPVLAIAYLPSLACLACLACGGATPAPAPVATTPGANVTPASSAAAPAPAGPSPIGKMAHVPAASFNMGSGTGSPAEMPVHPAHVTAFDIDLTEVTVAQYSQCVHAGGCVAAPGTVQWPDVTPDEQQASKGICNEDRPDRQDHAVNCVDWGMADAFCRWAGKRLPTEEEWEYAACQGDCDAAMKSKVGRAIARGASRSPEATPVASGSPGTFGLYDMAGNVWEWTASAFCPYDHPGCGDRRRVVRGGSWSMVDFLFVRLSDRSPGDPATRNTNVGFRCAKSSASP